MSGSADEFDGFDWDAAKSEATFAERGLDFEAAIHVFDGGYVEREDMRREYGERRYVVTGVVEDILVTVVWTPRGRARRIISAWPASYRERREYREYREAVERAEPNG